MIKADMSREFKVLFIYSGFFMQTSLPLGVASLVASLKKNGISVKVFDTVFYQEPGEVDENAERVERHHSVKAVDYSSVGIVKKSTDIVTDFKKLLLEFEPNLVALSSVESTFARGLKLAKIAKELGGVPVIAGGVFVTLAPETAIKEEALDIICVGEGEAPLLELSEKMSKGEDYTNIKSLWVKKSAQVIRNDMMPLKSLEDVDEPDFSEFDERMFYRPMQGRLFKTIPIEFSRGCPYQCAFCAEPALNLMYRAKIVKNYFRKKSIDAVMKEVDNSINKYSPEFFYFASETFLAMTENEFSEFISRYRKIKIPFWIQTRVETMNESRIRKLKEVGLYWLTMGVEHGDEEFRKKILHRRTKNAQIYNIVKMLDNCDQGASLNSILGFPFETKELIYKTIMLSRKLFKINHRIKCNISIFVPFRGCDLYDVCVSNNLITPKPYTSTTNISGGSMLRSDHITNEELIGLSRTFPLYVYMPDEYLDRIKVAERLSPEGNREYELLNKEVLEYTD